MAGYTRFDVRAGNIASIQRMTIGAGNLGGGHRRRRARCAGQRSTIHGHLIGMARRAVVDVSRLVMTSLTRKGLCRQAAMSILCGLVTGFAGDFSRGMRMMRNRASVPNRHVVHGRRMANLTGSGVDRTAFDLRRKWSQDLRIMHRIAALINGQCAQNGIAFGDR